MLDLWKRQPARLVGFVSALALCLVAFGVNLSGEQVAAITGVMAALLFLIGGEAVARTVYSPNTVEHEYVKKDSGVMNDVTTPEADTDGQL